MKHQTSRQARDRMRRTQELATQYAQKGALRVNASAKMIGVRPQVRQVKA